MAIQKKSSILKKLTLQAHRWGLKHCESVNASTTLCGMCAQVSAYLCTLLEKNGFHGAYVEISNDGGSSHAYVRYKNMLLDPTYSQFSSDPIKILQEGSIEWNDRDLYHRGDIQCKNLDALQKYLRKNDWPMEQLPWWSNNPQEASMHAFLRNIQNEDYTESKWFHWMAITTESGPFDGGCLLLANALAKLWDGEIHVLCTTSKKESIAQHAYVHVPKYGIWIDAYGSYTNAFDAAMMFAEEEGIRLNKAHMRPYDSTKDLLDAQELLFYTDTLVELLNHECSATRIDNPIEHSLTQM